MQVFTSLNVALTHLDILEYYDSPLMVRLMLFFPYIICTVMILYLYSQTLKSRCINVMRGSTNFVIIRLQQINVLLLLLPALILAQVYSDDI